MVVIDGLVCDWVSGLEDGLTCEIGKAFSKQTPRVSTRVEGVVVP